MSEMRTPMLAMPRRRHATAASTQASSIFSRHHDYFSKPATPSNAASHALGFHFLLNLLSSPPSIRSGLACYLIDAAILRLAI